MKFTTAFSLLAAVVGIASAAPATNVARASAPTHTGQATFTDFAVGSCGISNSDSELVVGVSSEFFNDFPGATSNPNKNPICNKQLYAAYKGKHVTVKIVDTCVGCGKYDLNFSPTAFDKLASEDDGRIYNVQWHVIGGGE